MISQETENNSMINFSESFSTEVLKKGFRVHLPEKTVANLIEDPKKRERFSLAFGFKNEATRLEIIDKVETIFTKNLEEERRLAPLRNNHKDQYLSEVETYHNSAAYQDLSELLGIAGTLTPVLAGDWEIGRIEAANYNLGIKDLRAFQEAIVYDSENEVREGNHGQFRHLHKGPGDCSLMRFLREENEDEIADLWSEEGVGYEFHHGPLEVLKKFIKPKKLKDPEKRAFLEQVILPQLRPALKSRWFDERGSVIKEHVPRVDYFDCNDLYDLLLKPKTWLKVNKTKLKISTEFENSGKVFIDPNSYGLALQYAGETDPRAVIRLKLNRLAAEHKSLKGKGVSDEKNQLKEQSTALRAELVILNETPPTQIPSQSDDKIGFLSDFFTHDFVEGLRQYANGNTRPDTNLNRHVHTDAHNFVPSTFKDIPDVFEDESFDLITGSRSDSHENNEDFVEDVMQNLKLLRPGGVLLTDGIKESYTRVLRVQDFMKAFKKQPQEFRDQFCIKVTMRSTPDESGIVRPRPVSLVVQCKHPSKNFSIRNTPPQNNLRDQFSDDIDLCDPEEVLTRPDIQLLDHARRILLSLSRESQDVDIFQKLHRPVTDMVHDVITEFAKENMGLDSWEVNNTEGQTTLSEQLEELYKGKGLALEKKQMKDIIRSLNKKITNLVGRVKARVTGAMVHQEGDTGVEHYIDSKVHLFKNRSLGRGQYNHARHLSGAELADNKSINTPSVRENINQKTLDLRNNLQSISETLNLPTTLTIVNFTECNTNQALVEAVSNIVERHRVRVIDIDLSKGAAANAKAFAELKRTEGLIISGGSLHDMHLEEGDMAVNGLGEDFLNRITDTKTPVVWGGICFSHQLFSRLIGLHTKFDLQVQEGLLEFGPTTIKGLHLEDNPFFDGLNATQLSTFMSHSGHLVSTSKVWQDTYDRMTKNHQLRACAKSEFTGKFVAYEYAGRQALCSQFHPEMSLPKPNLPSDPDHVKLFLKQVEQYEEGLRSKFGIGAEQLKNQFRVGRGKSKDFGGIKADAGKAILVNMIYTLSKTLINSPSIEQKRRKPEFIN